MKNKDLKIDIITTKYLVIGNILLVSFGAFFKIMHWEFSQIFLTAGLVLFLASWILILIDMIKNKIYNKTFWIITMFVMPFISIVFYIFQRDKLLNLGQKYKS
ncbi:MAG: hypothetical protein COB73_04835 [Flavobacteriaceae bacterium]|nr:MAG: hypothetical protein COB73_04835 [Flavobacteriaceae bacterium]